MAVLDVGCGQGTQAIELAKRGCSVTGVEPSAALRDLCHSDTKSVGVEMELLDGSIETPRHPYLEAGSSTSCALTDS